MDDEQIYDRAYGTLLGQCVGDAIGAQVEFSTASSISQRFPDGVREMTGGGPHQTLPGQITDDSELALALARAIVAKGHFDSNFVAAAYVDWKRSGPFDCGGTCGNAFGGQFDPEFSVADQMHYKALRCITSQANGALMRVSPIGIATVRMGQVLAEQFARNDAALSHTNMSCQIASAAFVVAIRSLILGEGETALDKGFAVARRASIDGHSEVFEWLCATREGSATNADAQQGWVKHGLQNAFYQLANAESFEEGIVDTIRLGGDTDTNAAIAGALLGARFGAKGIPERWANPVTTVVTDRPETYRTNDLPALANALLETPNRRD